MATTPDLRENFAVQTRFNMTWNADYPFANPAYVAEIDKQEAFDKAGTLSMKPYKSGGGDEIESPWGSNKALDAGAYAPGTVYDLKPADVVNPAALATLRDRPQEFCSKELVVKPGFMLSLQRHRGRQELWDVKEGTLTVILEGERIEVEAGQAIFIPCGAAHCMNNASDKPVRVVELQTGICREDDNVRLWDQSGRPVYPLTSEAEYRSAVLYRALMAEITQKRELGVIPKPTPA